MSVVGWLVVADIIALVLMIGSHSERLTRWFLWNARCQRGRRCANVIVDELQIGDADEPGSVILFAYLCEGCGTEYHSSVLVGTHGEFIQSERERV